MADFVLVLSTAADDGGADELARVLVEERLAACVNVLAPMRSMYRWEGEVQQESERQIVIKTTRARLPDLERRLHELHSYDVPEFLVVPVEGGSAGYLGWVEDSL